VRNESEMLGKRRRGREGDIVDFREKENKNAREEVT